MRPHLCFGRTQQAARAHQYACLTAIKAFRVGLLDPNSRATPTTSYSVSVLFLLGDVRSRPGILPIHAHRAAVALLVKVNGEVLNLRRGLRHAHVDPRQIIPFARIRDAPFAGFLADDERPLLLVGNGENGVAARRHILATDAEIGIGYEVVASFAPARHTSP